VAVSLDGCDDRSIDLETKRMGCRGAPDPGSVVRLKYKAPLGQKSEQEGNLSSTDDSGTLVDVLGRAIWHKRQKNLFLCTQYYSKRGKKIYNPLVNRHEMKSIFISREDHDEILSATSRLFPLTLLVAVDEKYIKAKRKESPDCTENRGKEWRGRGWYWSIAFVGSISYRYHKRIPMGVESCLQVAAINMLN
jgi:hypothetical protein